MVTSHDSLGLSWNLIRTLVMMMNSFIQAVSSIFFFRFFFYHFQEVAFGTFPEFFQKIHKEFLRGFSRSCLKISIKNSTMHYSMSFFWYFFMNSSTDSFSNLFLEHV